MAIQPIDLQTLFVRLSHVGREQSALKQAIAQNQIVTGNEIAQRSQDADHTVNETDEVPEGPDTVREDETGQGTTSGGKENGKREAGTDETNEDAEFRDPDLGHNVDLTG